MRDADQAARKKWIKDQANQQLIDEVKAVDAKNLARLKVIIHRYGWPQDKKASGAAWTLAQHGDAKFLRDVLPMMEKAVKDGVLHPGLYATSLDRVLTGEGKKQRYGTQFNTKGDKCEPMPIEDPEHLDERRKAMGLDPIADYTKLLCETYKRK